MLQPGGWHTKISVPRKRDKSLAQRMRNPLRLTAQRLFQTISFSRSIHGWNQRKAEKLHLDSDRDKLSDIEQVTPTSSSWNWRKSFTLTSIFAVLEGARSPRRLACLRDKSKSGFRTVGWNGRKTKNWTIHRERNSLTACENRTIMDITWHALHSAIPLQSLKHTKQKTCICSAEKIPCTNTRNLARNARLRVNFPRTFAVCQLIVKMVL